MKILHPLLCYYPSQAGGPANTIYWINKALDPKDFTIEVVATSFGIKEPIRSKILGDRNKASYFKSGGKKYISKSLKELNSTDIVQFSSLFFPPTLPILLTAIRKNKAIIISPRGELYDAAVSQKAIKKRIWISIIKLFQHKIHFHATNNFELQIIEKTFPKSKSRTVIPNFIEMPEKQDRETEDKILFLGRINPIKNIHILIDAISIVHKEYPHVKLEIFGSARLENEQEYLIQLKNKVTSLCLEDFVKFNGHTDGDKKNEHIASSKVLVLPSQSENFGNVVLEALAQGTPVIASKMTPWQTLEENYAGFWCEGDAPSIAENINKIFNLDKLEYRNMRKNAYELCKNQFDIKSNIHVWQNYYSKITTHVQK